MARVQLILVFLLLSSVVGSPVLGQRVRDLPGRVEDGNLHQPLRATVAAYADSRNERDEQCPAFDDFINRVDANSGGEFSLPIPLELETFTAVVCRAGYFPRIEPAVQNSDRTQYMLPLPVELISYDATPADYQAMTEDKLRRLDSDLSYLRGLDGGAAAIGRAIERLAASAEETGRGSWANALGAMREYFVEGEEEQDSRPSGG